MRKVRLLLTAAICLLLPGFMKPFALRLLGHRVGRRARIGPSIILVDRLVLADGSRIGGLNLISARRVVMRTNAYIGRMNTITGRLSLGFAEYGAIGNRNVVNQGATLAPAHPVQLVIGTWSKITANHYVNVGESIRMGRYSTIAGIGSQLWTHGFVHMSSGLDRAEIRGRIMIGDNVYIGAHSTIGPGITIANAVAVGAHSSVAKSLLEPGVYVSQPLRFIPLTAEQRLANLEGIPATQPGEVFYWRDGGGALPAAVKRAAPLAEAAE
ncbi:MAG: hypothetical protein KDJ41_09365 [Hyphomicrobiaceae bacterium]|nr:hypothetical protein [Hyphomicrobiaceae bacterium]